jgi:UDP:flavonoid glycosyltransferase YjiC (YdhE family)
VPLVVIPLFADQPANARLVTVAGAGVSVKPKLGSGGTPMIGPGDALRIRAAIDSVLADASYRQAASRIAAEMRILATIEDLLGVLAAASAVS